MGQQVVSCGCLEGVMSEGAKAKEAKERLAKLQEGAKFMKLAYLGLSAKEVSIKLSSDCSKLEWRTLTSGFLSSEEFGEIDLTSQVKTLKLNGVSGFHIVSALDEHKVILDLQASDQAVRDQWVLSINELLQDWRDHPDRKPQSTVSASGTSNKDDYFRQRQAEIESREKANADRKAKYAANGMQQTAKILASRAANSK